MKNKKILMMGSVLLIIVIWGFIALEKGTSLFLDFVIGYHKICYQK